MHSTTTVETLQALSEDERGDLLARLFDRLLPNPDASGVLAPPTAPLDNAADAAEEERVGHVAKIILENSDLGWAGVRRPVLSRFGAFKDGRWAALARANRYWTGLHPAVLLGVKGKPVAPAMQAHLDKATDYLRNTRRLDEPELVALRRTPGGLNIRANRNRKLVLSNHSFGLAIDLEPLQNPNIGSSDSLKPVIDLLGGERWFTGGGTAAEVEWQAWLLYTFSRAYVAIMSTTQGFDAGILDLVNRTRREERLPPLSDVAKLSTALLGRQQPQRATVVALVYPPGRQTPRRRAFADALLRLARARREAYPARGKPPSPSSEATLGRIARYGFLNLPPLLIAALAGNDAGGLAWLGWADVRDFMHFDVPRAERERILPAAATTPVTVFAPRPK